MSFVQEALILIMLVYIRDSFGSTAAGDWSYDIHPANIGPATWPEHFEMCSDSNKQQSPINIDLNKVVYTTSYGKIFVKQSEPLSFINVTHTGEHVKVYLPEGKVMLTGGRFDSGSYEAHDFHFHWGSDSLQGSEHLVNKQAYPMEMHVVAFDKGRYRSYADAAKGTGSAFGVLGVFFKISDADNPALTGLIADVKKLSTTTFVKSTWLAKLITILPKNLQNYYTYDGGFTTPGCDPLVLWTLLREPVSISERQIQAFRNLFVGGYDDIHLVNNYRPVQPLNGRIVTGRYCDGGPWCDAPGNKCICKES